MKQCSNLRRLSLRDFDAELLEELTREGRVYIRLPQVNDQNAYKHEVLEYVKPIRDYAAREWLSAVDDLWAQIVEADPFRDFLSMKKGLQAGHLNRYAVTLLVSRLQNMGIYRQDVAMLTLHLRMENTTKKNKYYTGCGNYVLPREAIRLLRQLITRV